MILVTGASGNVGGELVRLCEQNGERCIAAGRTNRWEDRKLVDYRYLDFDDPGSYRAAEGISTVFLVRPPQVSNVKKTVVSFLRRCLEYGVEKVVFLSLVGADRLFFVPHHAVEKHIERLGLAHTFLRAGFFMQNLSTTHAEEIRARNELVAPCGKGKTTFVHARDIAEIGYKALSGKIEQEAVDVAGEDTLTYGQVAEKLSKLLGRSIVYRSPSPLGFIRYRTRHGTPLRFALVMTGIYLPTRFGGAAYRGQTRIRDYLGRPPVGFDTFLREEKGVWQ